jgi:hypothetical protein
MLEHAGVVVSAVGAFDERVDAFTMRGPTRPMAVLCFKVSVALGGHTGVVKTSCVAWVSGARFATSYQQARQPAGASTPPANSAICSYTRMPMAAPRSKRAKHTASPRPC